MPAPIVPRPTTPIVLNSRDDAASGVGLVMGRILPRDPGPAAARFLTRSWRNRDLTEARCSGPRGQRRHLVGAAPGEGDAGSAVAVAVDHLADPLEADGRAGGAQTHLVPEHARPR